MSDDLGDVLQRFCIQLVADPALQPEYNSDGALVRTHCNQASRKAAQLLNCSEFDNEELLADDMYAIMKSNVSKRWKVAGGQEATLHALNGGLAFAAMPGAALGETHGHITVICPLGMQRSGSLDKDVPVVANVGKGDPGSPLGVADKHGVRRKKNWICKASQAFPVKEGEPAYFVWS